MMLKNIHTILLVVFGFSIAFSQQKTQINPVPRGTSSANYRIGCSLFTEPNNYSTGSSFSYNAPVNNNSNLTTGSGTNFGCMASVPNQAWFIITVNSGGNLYFNFSNSNGYDVDAVIWGPISGNDVANACASTQNYPATCDWDAGRPDLYLNGAQAGQKYVMLVTNYSNANTVINITQPTGGSVTYSMVNLPNCSLVPTATISGTSTTITEGQPASLSLSFTGSSPWNYTLSDGTMGTAYSSPANVSVYPTASQTYTINSVNNLCGTSGGSGSVGISVTRNVILKTCMPLDGNATDAQGINSGSLENGAVSTTNRNSETGKAIQFDGVDDFVSITANQLNNNTFAFATWVKLDELPSINNPENIALTIGGTSDEQFLGVEYYNGNPSWKFSSNGNNVYSNAIVDLNWHLLVGVRTGGQLKLYVDGLLTGTEYVTGMASYGSPLSARIGSSILNNKFFKGKIDDIKIFSGSLIEPEILLLQNYTSCNNVYNDTFISVQSVSTSVICTGTSFVLRAFSNNVVPDGQLQFTAELSDASGNFSNPTIIGTSPFLPLTVTIPNNIPGGNYKVRIRYGGLISVNSFSIFVNNPATYNINGTVALNDGQSSNLSLNFTGTGPWNYIMSDGLSGVATTTPWLITVTPDQSTTYSISSAQNVCGYASINGNSSATVSINYTKQFVTCLPFTGNATDTKGNNTATVNGPILTENRYGQTNTAYNFNGSGNYIEYTTNLLRKREFTMSAWVMANSISGSTQYILSQGEAGTNTFQGLGVNSSGWFFQSYSNSGQSIIYNSTSLATNQWVHLTAVRTYQSLKLYINGNLVTSTSNSSIIPFKTSDIGRVGANSSTLGNYFNGKIDDVKLYKGALNDEEVYALYANTNDCPTVENAAIIVARSISPTTVCAGNNINVGYSLSNVNVSIGSPLTVQLSDANGFFGSPTILGTGSSSPISVTIPTNTFNSNFYRIRLVSAGNVISVNSMSLIVSGSLPTATISGGGSIPFGGTASLTINFTGTAPWTYALNNGTSQIANTSPATISVSPFGTTTYSVTSVSNTCGAGSGLGSAVVNVAPNITLGTIANSFCQSQTFNIPFTSNYTASPSFRAEISDASGNFSSPISIGNGTTGNISATIPNNTPAGNTYKIRIVSDSPAYTSPEFSGITILEKSNATISGSTTINEGETANLTVNFTGTAPFTYSITGGTSQSTSLTSITIPVIPVVTTTYSITTLSNTCGSSNGSGNAVITVNPVPIRLVSCFPFNGNANDSKGLNNGTVYGATLTTDRFGNANSAYSFDGNDYIEFSSNHLINNYFTYSVWANPATNSGAQNMLLLNIGGETYYQSLSMLFGGPNDSWSFRIVDGNGIVYSSNSDPQNSIPLNRWYHIAGVRDASNIKIYVDGVLVATTAISSTSTQYGANNPSDQVLGRIGALRPNLNFGYFNGFIDDVQIYKGALTANQISYIFNSGSPCSDPSLLPFLTLNSLTSNVLCQNQTINVPYTSVNINPTVESPVKVELSDQNGSFTSPVILGTSTSTSGNISVQIPQNQTPGTDYKFRLKQGNIISNLSGIVSISSPTTATISGDSRIYEDGSTMDMLINFTGTPPFQYTLNDGSTGSSTQNSKLISSRPFYGWKYELSSVSNACGNGTTSGSAEITLVPKFFLNLNCFPFSGNLSDQKTSYSFSNFGATYTTDRNNQLNKALSFDGLSLINNSSSNLTNEIDFIATFWIKPTSTFSTKVVIARFKNKVIYLKGGGTEPYRLQISTGTPPSPEQAQFYLTPEINVPNLSQNSWNFIAFKFETLMASLNVNGIWVLNNTYMEETENVIGASLGGSPSETSRFIGVIDNLQTFTGQMSSDEINTIFSSSTDCSDQSTFKYLKFTSALTKNACRGQNVSVDFESLNISVNEATPIIFELSDNNGSFSSPVTLGNTLKSFGNISLPISQNLALGSGYKIRIKYGSTFSSNLISLSIFSPLSATISGSTTINEGNSANVTINFSGSVGPYNFAVNGGNNQSVLQNPYTFSVNPDISTTYQLTNLYNGCGAGVINGSAIITVNPVAIRVVSCFPFTGTLADSKTANTLTNFGAVLTSDKSNNPNNAFLFDGINDYFSLTTNSLKNQFYSYFSWINIPSPKVFAMPNDFVIFHLGSVGVSENHALWITYEPDMGFGPEKFSLRFYAPGINQTFQLSGVSFNQWNHFGVTRSSNGYKIFLNGQAITGNIGTIGTLTYPNPLSLFIGESIESFIPSGIFKGKIDNFQIYKGALTPGQVQALYQNTDPCFDATTYTCLSDNVFTSILSGQQTLQVSNQIIGRSTLQGGSNIHFDSKNSVILEPGFKTEPNTVFKATVGGGCN